MSCGASTRRDAELREHDARVGSVVVGSDVDAVDVGRGCRGEVGEVGERERVGPSTVDGEGRAEGTFSGEEVDRQGQATGGRVHVELELVVEELREVELRAGLAASAVDGADGRAVEEVVLSRAGAVEGHGARAVEAGAGGVARDADGLAHMPLPRPSDDRGIREVAVDRAAARTEGVVEALEGVEGLPVGGSQQGEKDHQRSTPGDLDTKAWRHLTR